MQLEIKDLLSVNPKTTKSRSVILSERDLSILEFLLDMKFASLKDLFERFFQLLCKVTPREVTSGQDCFGIKNYS